MLPDPPPPTRFDSTNWSALGRGDVDFLIRSYWKPIFRFLRSRLPDEDDAEEAVQEFFLRFLERDILSRLDRDRGRFRTFLYHLARQFLIDLYRSRGAAKRGGDREKFSLENLTPADASSTDPRKEFDRQWFLELLEEARESVKKRLMEEGKPEQYRAFRLYYFGGAEPGRWTHDRIAEEVGLSPGQVNDGLHRTRRLYADAIRSLVADYSTPGEVEAEMRDLGQFLAENRLPGSPASAVTVFESDPAEKKE